MSNKINELRGSIDEKELLALAKTLVSIESHSGIPTFEEEAAKYINRFLLDNNIKSRMQKIRDHRFNVIADFGENGEKTLLFTGHIDTVGDYGHKGLFSPKVKDGKLYGRGSCDMKGAVAAMIEAVLTISRLSQKPRCNIKLAFAADEEFKSIGTEKLIESNIKADAAILGEPTGLNICLGNRGLEWVNVLIVGKGTHGAAASRGINAILGAAKLIDRVQKELVPQFALRSHPVLGNPVLNFGMIQGGNQPSTVPESCLIKIDRRWIDGESVKSIYDEFQRLIDKLHEEDDSFNAILSRDLSNINKMEHGPVCIDKDNPVVKSVFDAASSVLSYEPSYKAFPGWSDASLLSNFGHIPTVIFGPGDIGCAHCEREYTDLKELYKAAEIYALTALTY